MITLRQAAEHLGHGVVYTPAGGGQVREGKIVWVSDLYVFVRYTLTGSASATRPEDLTFLAPPDGEAGVMARERSRGAQEDANVPGLVSSGSPQVSEGVQGRLSATGSSLTDYTCGACGTGFGSNCLPGDIECTECDARLCSNCGYWEERPNG